MTISEWIANRINQLCASRNITVNKLATLSGLTQSTIESIVRGKSKNPSIRTIKKICDGLGLSITDFFDSTFNDLEVD